MTSDRHLNLTALMNEIEAPSATYRRSVRLAASTETDTPANSRAIDSGNAALDDIERAVRFWVDGNRPQPIPGLCNTPSPDRLFMCRLKPHTNAEMHSDRSAEAVRPNGRRMVWETPVAPPAGFERHSCVTVACAVCGDGYYDEQEGGDHFGSIAVATSEAVGAGWAELDDGRVVCETRDEKHNELRAAVGVAETGE